MKRQEEGATNAEINRETAALKRAFNLAMQAEKITRKPHVPKLEENSPRQGFFESWQFDALLPKLPDFLRPPITFAYWTGWRMYSEVLSLTWDRVDLEAGTVRLYKGTTKNKEAVSSSWHQNSRRSLNSNGPNTSLCIQTAPWCSTGPASESKTFAGRGNALAERQGYRVRFRTISDERQSGMW